MSEATRAVAIIPVRVQSQRLPGKALLTESGQPLFVHTCQQALAADCFDRVLVATDDEEVRAAAEQAGIEVVMTSSTPRTGSERCAEVAKELSDTGWVVDIQGDWPEVAPGDLRRMVESMRQDEHAIVTLAAPLHDVAQIQNPNVVKLVRGHDGRALYFSRLPVPFSRQDDQNSIQPRLRHIGVYGFQRDILVDIPALGSSGLDESEGLEQLKWLENGLPIQALDAEGDPWGIETREDYDAFLQRIAGQREIEQDQQQRTPREGD